MKQETAKDGLVARIMKAFGLIKICMYDDDYIFYLEKRVIELDRKVQDLTIKNFD